MITLDDPAMHAAVSEELKADGFAVLSEFSRGTSAEPEERAGGKEGVPGKGQVAPRTGKPVSGSATYGKATSGKPRSGEPAAINYSSDGKDEKDKRLSPSPLPAGETDEKGEEEFEPYRKGEFPDAFERLCSLSLKSVTSLRFKRDRRAA